MKKILLTFVVAIATTFAVHADSNDSVVNKETLIEIAGPLDCHSYGQSVETALIESGEVSNFDAERAGIEAYFACEGANDLIDAFVDAWNYFF